MLSSLFRIRPHFVSPVRLSPVLFTQFFSTFYIFAYTLRLSDMGAYTVASASHFNGFQPPNARYLITMQPLSPHPTPSPSLASPSPAAAKPGAH